MATKQAAAVVPEPPPLPDVTTPEHLADLAAALELYAVDQQRLDPERAAAARRAAQHARSGAAPLYRVGRFYHPTDGWVPNYECLPCLPRYSNTSERLIATHAIGCQPPVPPMPQPARTVGGIT